MPPIIKAIGNLVPQQPLTSPLDWTKVRLEPSGSTIDLLYGTRVEFQRAENNRDYFKILDFEHQNREASLSHEQVGGTFKSRLIQPLAYLGPAKVDWDAGIKKVVVSIPGTPSIPKIEATGKSDTDPANLSNGTFKLRPRMEVFRPGTDPPALGEIYKGYLRDAPHFYTWFLIEYQPARGFFLHAGRASAGCVTVTEMPKWESIFQLLVRCRTPDFKHIGEITVKGHGPSPFKTSYGQA